MEKITIKLTEGQVKRLLEGQTHKMTTETLFSVGKKYFKKLQFHDNRYYLKLPKSDFSYSYEDFGKKIAKIKIDMILKEMKPNNVEFSSKSNSVYFYLGKTAIRLSDHGMNNVFNGEDFVISWRSDPYDVMVKLDKIKENSWDDYMTG